MSTSTQPTAAMDVPPEHEEWILPSKGKVGMACLILTESTFFAIFVVAHLFYLGKSLTGPFADVLNTPIIASICLLSSSLTVVMATRALARGKLIPFELWMLATIALGGVFLGATGIEWWGLIYNEGLTIYSNLLGTTFYSLVGFHALHVTIGLSMLAFVLILCLLGHVREEHAERVEILSWYWHFVDAVWIVVFTVVYVIR
jgi:cytochrome c oxidase subunit 3/cytochrome o ubiquinol oxidase subunit 3